MDLGKLKLLASTEGFKEEILRTDPDYWLQDMEYLYMRSYNELESLFRNRFQQSEHFKEMVYELHQNVIEYKFLLHAGIF